ncbi:hypothetical protein [Anatilimnocola floriformis]|nr:hypothetical protein [Anatilimnocola floriformis]
MQVVAVTVTASGITIEIPDHFEESVVDNPVAVVVTEDPFGLDVMVAGLISTEDCCCERRTIGSLSFQLNRAQPVQAIRFAEIASDDQIVSAKAEDEIEDSTFVQNIGARSAPNHIVIATSHDDILTLPPASRVVKPEVGVTVIPAASLSVFDTATSATLTPLWAKSVSSSVPLIQASQELPSVRRNPRAWIILVQFRRTLLTWGR